MKKKMVSIIVPCYNYGDFIPDTLESLLDQSYQDWECIIIDDGSTDCTEEISLNYCKKDERFKYFYQSNSGLSAARNIGLELAQGEFIQFLDADDLLEEEKLSEHVAFLFENPNVDLVYSKVKYFNERGKLYNHLDLSMKEWMPNICGDGKTILGVLLERNIMAVNCPLIKKLSLVKFPIVFNTNLTSLEDWDLWIRMALDGARFEYYSPELCQALVRIHPYSMSQNRAIIFQNEIIIRDMIKVNDPHLMKLNESLLQTANERYEWALRNICFSNLKGQKYYQGLKQLITLIVHTKKVRYYLVHGLYWLRKGITHA